MKYRVVLSKWAQKDLRKVPRHVADKLFLWVMGVETKGLPELRKISGFHDEPLRGEREGQRSIRLSRSYRAFYVELREEVMLVQIIEVNKHAY